MKYEHIMHIGELRASDKFFGLIFLEVYLDFRPFIWLLWQYESMHHTNENSINFTMAFCLFSIALAFCEIYMRLKGRLSFLTNPVHLRLLCSSSSRKNFHD